MTHERRIARTTLTAAACGLSDAAADLRVARLVEAALRRRIEPDGGRGARGAQPLVVAMVHEAARGVGAAAGLRPDMCVAETARTLAAAAELPPTAEMVKAARRHAHRVLSTFEPAVARTFGDAGAWAAGSFVASLDAAYRELAAERRADCGRLRDLAARLDELDQVPEHLAREARDGLEESLRAETDRSLRALLASIVRGTDAYVPLARAIRARAGEIQAATNRLTTLLRDSFARLVTHLEGCALLDEETEERLTRGALGTDDAWTACFAEALRCDASIVGEQLLDVALRSLAPGVAPERMLLAALARDVTAEAIVDAVAAPCREAARDAEGSVLENVRGREQEVLSRLLERTLAAPRLTGGSEPRVNVGVLLPPAREGEQAARAALEAAANALGVPDINVHEVADDRIVVFRVHYAWAAGENRDLNDVIRSRHASFAEARRQVPMAVVGEWIDAPWIPRAASATTRGAAPVEPPPVGAQEPACGLPRSDEAVPRPGAASPGITHGPAAAPNGARRHP
jgi:hypothetical protein